jgi:hypothetical protein
MLRQSDRTTGKWRCGRRRACQSPGRDSRGACDTHHERSGDAGARCPCRGRTGPFRGGGAKHSPGASRRTYSTTGSGLVSQDRFPSRARG